MRNPFKRTWSDKERVQFEFLRNFELFQALSDKELALFLPYMHERSYITEEAVFFRNDPSHALYLLKKGRVRLLLDINEKFEILAEFSHYNMLGENCIIPNTKRPMTALVISETAQFMVIPKDNIMTIFENNSEIKMKMMESFALINERYLKGVFKFYRSSFGLFNLSDVFNN